jgi:hypothetical protein
MEHNPEYMDLQTLWNDRRDPHANPLSTSPRREAARGKPGSLGQALEGVYRGAPGDTTASYPLANQRLYKGQRR